MITSIRLQNFKGHRDTTVPLGRLTVLVGPNGAGKTSVLEALALQSRLVTEAPVMVFSGDNSPVDLTRRGGENQVIIATEGLTQQGNWSALTNVAMDAAGRLVAFSFDWKHDNDLRSNKNWGNPTTGDLSQIRRVFGTAALYKLSARNIAAAAYSHSVDPVVGYDGVDTAVALAAIKMGRDEDFARIEQEIRLVIPNIERVRIKPATVQVWEPKLGSSESRIGSKISFDFRGAANVPAHLASEGTLVTLAILTVLHGPNRPSVLLLDDFDQSLHPQAQIEMVRVLKRLLEEFPDVQIVATTHSPYILDELSPEDVVVFALRTDGTVATKRLSEHPQAAKMKDALSAGQLWSLDPEADWVPDEATAAQ